MSDKDREDYEAIKRGEKVKPDPEDYAIEREYGPFPPNASDEECGERYRLAQARKLIRLYERGPSTAWRNRRPRHTG